MPIFIFARDAMDVVLAGGKTLVVPEDARITMAAWEVIRDHGLQVEYQPPAECPPPAAPAEPAGEPGAKPSPKSAQAEPDGAITDEDVETILNRVLERLGRAKGEPVSAPKGSTEAADDDDMVICRCEEITKGEIREAIRTGMGTLNGIKRVTRAGMGLCQGQTCNRLVTQILCSELGLSPAEVAPVTARAPVRPVRLSALATG